MFCDGRGRIFKFLNESLCERVSMSAFSNNSNDNVLYHNIFTICDEFPQSVTVFQCSKKKKVKVKVTLVQALRLCTGRTARRGSTGIALPFHDHGIRRG